MLQVKNAIQWFPCSKVEGVVRLPSHTVTDARRGITFDRPEGFYVDTPFGRHQLIVGSWLVTCASGNRYIVKEGDYMPQKISPFDTYCNYYIAAIVVCGIALIAEIIWLFW